MSVLSEKILNLPAAPGVYLFKDARGEALYIGKALRLSSRGHIRANIFGASYHKLRQALVDRDAAQSS